MPRSIAAPPPDCRLCPRLGKFRDENRGRFPDYHNAPVPSFGPADARLLIVGLAPGLHGANATGRPFTGDYAGDLLFAELQALDLAAGDYGERADDGLALQGCRIVNAVRCVPPQNKPLPAEIAGCNAFLAAELAALPRAALLALGRVAHDAILAALRAKKSAYPFAHGARHALPDGRALVDSYHCSRYNTNTGVLTPTMFRAALRMAKDAAGL